MSYYPWIRAQVIPRHYVKYCIPSVPSWWCTDLVQLQPWESATFFMVLSLFWPRWQYLYKKCGKIKRGSERWRGKVKETVEVQEEENVWNMWPLRNLKITVKGNPKDIIKISSSFWLPAESNLLLNPEKTDISICCSFFLLL